jgi:NinB protein
MTRYLIPIRSSVDRLRIAQIAAAAPVGTRCEFKSAKRSIPQSDYMWGLLSDIAQQKEHAGRRYTPDQWKVLFMHACGREVQFIPSLDNSTFIPWGNRSSDLSKDEMSALIECIKAWGAENNVRFFDEAEAAA